MSAAPKEVDLAFEHVSKRYVVKQERAEGGSRSLLGRLRALRQPSADFWALRDVSFAVERGEVLGIIGHNGAGKSTILKLLSNITSPTTGRIRINGRLSALIEVGSGFHPELTGRENIFLNGAILGMRRSEISAKLDSIADFAGIRAFLDVPVKRFSSGMYVRLGFSIAAHLDPDILLLDEVLAVGDAAFQEKCLGRITELREAGKTIVFISHDLAAVERICTRVILMRRGQIVTSGAPAEVIAEYQRLPAVSRHNIEPTIVADDSAKIELVELRDLDGQPMPPVHTAAPIAMRIHYTVRRPLPDVVFEVLFNRPDHELAAQWTTEENGEPIALDPGEGVLEFRCDELGFMPGIYHATVVIRERGAPEAIDRQWGAVTFRVDPGKPVAGAFYMSHRWTLRTLAHRAEG